MIQEETFAHQIRSWSNKLASKYDILFVPDSGRTSPLGRLRTATDLDPKGRVRLEQSLKTPGS